MRPGGVVIVVLGFALAGCGPDRAQPVVSAPKPINFAAQDDVACRSYGAKFGSDAYVKCRMERDTQRQAEAGQAQAQQAQMTAALISRMAIPAAPTQPPAPPSYQMPLPVNTQCASFGSVMNCTTQ